MCMAPLHHTYEINHIVPHCIDGDDHPRNLVALCKHCHGRYTQSQAIWIRRATTIRDVCPSWRLCLGCRDVVSTHFRHTCDEKFTHGQFPLRAHHSEWLDIVDTWSTPKPRRPRKTPARITSWSQIQLTDPIKL